MDKTLPVSLSTLVDKSEVTVEIVAYPLKTWSPVLVPVITASFVCSTVV